ncbi:diphthamide biosynthesis protein [Pleomassaria siparia CBS 279.74]|uniref:2-(3-amino-3-carboxypropyl)histidine synthase subunit 2 n=1 Tax=Pleomassaria siparia CBS 279.74 TaxID=1314801 RepID=A0A6G1K1D1_9PLEO|nr:diphthamide biosynthesis protein [Pleomassaria siparia CBS 279.74]
MSNPALTTAPVLSTPDTHIFEDPTPISESLNVPRLPDELIALTYEIERTVRDIRAGTWKRIALQFPDHMLVDAPRVYDALRRGLRQARNNKSINAGSQLIEDTTSREEELAKKLGNASITEEKEAEEKLFILADSSYGACCVDEVAAEHVDADVVVHYGRSCLSPPSRLPVVYVFTAPPLDLEAVVTTFGHTYPDKNQKVILMADIPYSHHVPALHARLRDDGYTAIYATEILHNPSSLLPNRSVPSGSLETLREYQLFHVSEPPTSLLLTLSSRVGAIHIYPTDSSTIDAATPSAVLASSARTLNRRYAILTSLSTASVFGILVNTLSVKNYLHIMSHVQSQIAAAGKKSYTFVVGKVNAAKVANFSEIGGWVVIGCWESSLIESTDFWKPLITPFELALALQGDSERVWTGEWTGDFQAILEERKNTKEKGTNGAHPEANGDGETKTDDNGEYDSEEESAPPEYDLRAGRYVSQSRPMRSSKAAKESIQIAEGEAAVSSAAVIKRVTGDLVQVGGVVSPGAEFLRSQRTWQGLGTDFSAVIAQEENDSVNGSSARMEEGRSGIARGYVVGTNETRH